MPSTFNWVSKLLTVKLVILEPLAFVEKEKPILLVAKSPTTSIVLKTPSIETGSVISGKLPVTEIV